AKNPALFVAEQPTQGLDITATEEVWHAILAQRDRSAVLLFTDDLKEALSLSDRIAVMFCGRILEIIKASDADSVGRIGLLMAGARG
ncbi:MAG: ABC transporter ATP-binding protein, partial [Deltaproteobacteria bacterium]